MTDIASTPIAVEQPARPSEERATPGLGATFKAIAALVGDAFRMAYVDPYVGRNRTPRCPPREDGRDPEW